MRNDMGFGMFRTMFMLIFLLVFVTVIGGFAVSVVLGYQCYASGNPNSMACFMVSDRHEIGIRNR